jgi:hypothetical protein
MLRWHLGTARIEWPSGVAYLLVSTRLVGLRPERAACGREDEDRRDQS